MIKNYLTVAFRNLWRNRGFSLINILGLAVGLTAFFLIFLWVSFETSYDRFHTKADRIYRVVSTTRTPSETERGGLTIAPVAVNVKKEFPEVEEAVRLGRDEFLVRKGDARFQEKRMVMADSGLFRVFDFPLIAGDPNTALREPLSVVLSQSTARKYFGDANPVGQQVLLTGGAVPATVTGVMKDIPENSQIQADLFVSLSSSKPLYGQPTQDSEWTNHNYYTYLLLKPHADARAFEKKLPGFMEFHHGAEANKIQMWESLNLEPLRDVYLRSPLDGFVTGSIRNVYIFSTVALFILLIACINFINLTTARSTERAKEVGVRKVIGAGRRQLAGQFIGESVLICLLAFFVSLLLASLLMPLFNMLSGKVISPGVFYRPVYVFGLLLLAVFIGVVAGFYPSLVLSAFKPVSVLKGRFATGSQGLLLRRALVVFQFVISTVLIVGTIVVYRQVQYMRDRELGFSKDQEIIINTNYDKNKDVFKASLATIPGVVSSCFSNGVPGGGYNSAYSQVENRAGKMQQTNLDGYFVDFDFIRQYRLKLVAGRAFSTAYPTDSTKAMMINESAAKMLGYAEPQEAVGRNFDQWGRQGKIIGVLKDFNYKSLRSTIAPFTLRIEPYGFGTISIKVSTANLAATVKAIEHNWNRIIPNRPFEFVFLDDLFNRQYTAETGFGRLFVNFAALAIFISCLGVLGLASYSTIQRRKEIGVRKVLGASVGSIVRMLSGDFLRLVLVALVIASPVGWWVMSRWLHDFAYRAPIGWRVFAVTAGLSLLVVFVTISFQAVKAARANPVTSLRSE